MDYFVSHEQDVLDAHRHNDMIVQSLSGNEQNESMKNERRIAA